jgi:hypothetical protein
MHLMAGYNYYFRFPGSTAPGIITKIESIENQSYWINYNGLNIGVSADGFREASVAEWRLAGAFKQLRWSRKKQIKWCNQLFPRRRGVKLPFCAFSGWNDIQKAIAAACISKIARRHFRIETTFLHPRKIKNKK